MPATHSILFGTSGFQYPDWKGIVYPSDVKKRYEHELACIAEYFDCCGSAKCLCCAKEPC